VYSREELISEVWGTIAKVAAKPIVRKVAKHVAVETGGQAVAHGVSRVMNRNKQESYIAREDLINALLEARKFLPVKRGKKGYIMGIGDQLSGSWGSEGKLNPTATKEGYKRNKQRLHLRAKVKGNIERSSEVRSAKGKKWSPSRDQVRRTARKQELADVKSTLTPKQSEQMGKSLFFRGRKIKSRTIGGHMSAIRGETFKGKEATKRSPAVAPSNPTQKELVGMAIARQKARRTGVKGGANSGEYSHVLQLAKGISKHEAYSKNKRPGLTKKQRDQWATDVRKKEIRDQRHNFLSARDYARAEARERGAKSKSRKFDSKIPF